MAHLVYCHSTARLGLSHQENRGNHAQDGHAQEPETVDIRKHGGLALHGALNQRPGARIEATRSYTSTVALHDAEALSIEVKPSSQPKCVRCFHLRSDVGSDPRHPELCARCVVNVEGPGEEREFA